MCCHKVIHRLFFWNEWWKSTVCIRSTDKMFCKTFINEWEAIQSRERTTPAHLDSEPFRPTHNRPPLFWTESLCVWECVFVPAGVKVQDQSPKTKGTQTNTWKIWSPQQTTVNCCLWVLNLIRQRTNDTPPLLNGILPSWCHVHLWIPSWIYYNRLTGWIDWRWEESSGHRIWGGPIGRDNTSEGRTASNPPLSPFWY